MVGLSRITVRPELMLTLELERETATLDEAEAGAAGSLLGTTIEAVPKYKIKF